MGIIKSIRKWAFDRKVEALSNEQLGEYIDKAVKEENYRFAARLKKEQDSRLQPTTNETN